MSPEMEKELYGLPGPDFFHVDDLLDFSNDGLFSSSTVTDSNPHHHLPPPENLNGNRPPAIAADCDDCNRSTSFSDDLCVPTDDIAELEWLSMFVDDSFTDFSVEELAETMSNRPEASVPGRARSKRSRGATTHNIWTSLPQCDTPATGKSKPASNSSNRRKESSPASSVITRDQLSPSSSSSSGPRKCMHCASEKTPQWRTGPLGPKTLCNACGVRYKSGRLVPEYRPAASPTFVLTQHSNSHRKVMELRRQKEMLRQESGSNYQFYQHHHDFKVC